ncbi:MAG: hypothetical protein ABII00_06625 [Elusimicrobiota bacterium]
MMRNILAILAVLCILFPRAALARDPFGGFKQYVDRGSLKPFTRDLGSVLGAATFHSGRNLGFSGFDLGIRGGLQLEPSKGNTILRRRGVKAFGLPWVQVEIGLPFRLDGYIRGISFRGLTVAGGGLRYGIKKSADKPRSPQFLLAWSAHSVTQRDFTATHIGLNLISSVRVKWVTPYLGVGADRTRVVVRCVPVIDPAFEGGSATTTESRFTVGVSVHPKAYVYLHGGYTLTHGRSGFDSGVGIRF